MKTESTTFGLSNRLAVTFTIADDGRIDAEWSPCLPKRLTLEEAQEYRRVRNIMLGRLAQRMGVGAVAVVEV